LGFKAFTAAARTPANRAGQASRKMLEDAPYLDAQFLTKKLQIKL
jgi:hypothetical protein